ncbi:MAG TPA: TonB C-terminal domain-containing protein, partial [Rhodocyclaceae bacterium]|nr:TonB C-terminal domain-containing protein [Rhodocyclaceae bacterium]
MSDGPHVSRAAPGKRISIALAVAVHILLAVFLIYGIRWQTKATDVVEVDLVPAPAAPAPEKAAPPAVAEPPPPRPEPRIEPRIEPRPAPPPKADIAIKEKPKPPKEEPKRPSFLDSLNREFEQLTTRKADAEAARDKAAQEAAQKSAAQDKMRVAWYDRIKAKI